MTADKVRHGGCLCGAVRFEVSPVKKSFTICHCGTCRKWSAGPFMSVHCKGGGTFTKKDGLTWYRSSTWAERGFCARCGSNLFYRLAENPDAMLTVAVDAFDDADDLTLARHFYIDAKPARYDFADDRPRLTEAELLAELGITPG